MVLTKVLDRLKCIGYDLIHVVNETEGDRKKEAKLDLEALGIAIVLIEKEVNNV